MANYFATYVQDLEQDPFDPTDFVERLAWRLTGGSDTPTDPNSLHRALEEEISSLQLLSDQYQGKIQRLQNQCGEEEEEFAVTLERLQSENRHAVDKLKDLGDKINSVAAKVVHLGDQLESVNAPRSRALEALQLMKHFNEFLNEQHPLESDVFTDPDKLLESAEVIHKLAQVAQELSVEKYHQVQTRITYKYDEIERLMIEEFVRTHRLGNRTKLKQIAEILSNFKGYSQCVNAFVEHIQIGAFRSSDVFNDMLTLCQKTHPTLHEVFPNPDQVMEKLVLNIFDGKLREHIQSKLGETPRQEDKEGYLTNLYDLYSRTCGLEKELSILHVGGADKEFVPTLIRHLFKGYLDSYIATETHFLKSQSAGCLSKFYAAKGHQKRAIQGGGGLQDLKRDLQARILNVESFGGETFLSEEVAISILQETKLAFQRCHKLSSAKNAAENTQKILDVLLQYLCQEHLEYAVDLALYGIPLSEPKSEPQSHFFLVVRQAAAISHLFQKQFDDSILPLVKGTQYEDACVSRKRMALKTLESKMSNGLDRQLNAISGYVRFLLTSEQKKTDYYRSEQEDTIIPLCSSSCSAAVRYLTAEVERIRDSVDGSNLQALLTELGVRVHRAVLDQIYQFQYTCSGAMLLLCDVNEYRKCVNGWSTEGHGGIPLVNKLFETLHALSNLLVVVPDNLNDACAAELLEDVDRSIVVNFIQLRADYRTAKLYNDFR